jgi:ribosomal protein S9
VRSLGLVEKETKNGDIVDWTRILEVQGGYVPGSGVWFKKASGYEIVGTFVINPLDSSILTVSLDTDTYPANDDIASTIPGVAARGTVDAIIDPYKYNPLEVYGSHAAIPLGLRFLMLDDVNNSENRGGYINLPSKPADSTSVPYRGPQAWREPSNNDSSWENQDGTDPVIKANSIIEWTGGKWVTIWDPDQHTLEAADILGEEFSPTYIRIAKSPLSSLGLETKYDVYVNAQGGGLTGQTESIRLGLARALCKVNPENRTALKFEGYLTRDARATERKKYGLRKARKAPQFSKR